MITHYKKTLNLPFTTFSMRGNLVHHEPERLKAWCNNNLYHMIRSKKNKKNIFFIHDGPPYANGNIHLGHAINKILKDIIIKSKELSSYNVPYIPGWDCHGLPIELKVEDIIIKSTDSKVSHEHFRLMCRKYAQKQMECQKKDFIRLGVLGDWENSYSTMDFSTEANIIRCLSQIISKGYLYRGLKPTYWCIKCSSVLSEAEIEYHSDHTSPSVYVKFFSSNSSHFATKFGIKNFKYPISLIVWNTTPWTLPGNRALAVHPDYNYCLVGIDKEYYVFAISLLKSILNCTNVSNYKIFGVVKGKDLEFSLFKHPFMSYNVPVILANYIVSNVGTGVVHIAPGHGIDDYAIAHKYNLEIINLVNENGYYKDGILPSLNNMNVLDANNVVISLLKRSKNIFFYESIQHAYPYCWRHKHPIIVRTTFQWFIDLEHRNLRQLCLSKINDMNWIPSTGKSTIKSMVFDRPDWCISRQRNWGVPITIFLHKNNGSLHPRTVEIMEQVAKKVEKSGVQAWWDLDPNEIIGSDVKEYDRVFDVLDVWFDSAASYFSSVSIRSRFKNYIPDMYLEGSDQYRGWFMSSLLLSLMITGEIPCKTVLVHGFIVDSQGKKMSKSFGNVVSPKQIINKFGVDVLRLWVASNDYTTDMVLSDESLKHSSVSYRKIRNTVRFILGNLKDFDPGKHIVSSKNMVALDRWVIDRTLSVQLEIISNYKNYNFHKIIQRIVYFCSVELGSFYLDIIKDRQYVMKRDSVARRSSQTALYYIIEAMVRWIAPIVPFTADEIWKCLPGNRPLYVFFEEWYSKLFVIDSSQIMNATYWATFLQVRVAVNKIIEQERKNGCIGSSLEAGIILYAESKLAGLLRKLGDEIRFGFLTSSVVVMDYDFSCVEQEKTENIKSLVQGLKISLEKAQGRKCHRCWHYTLDVGKCKSYPDICNRCVINLFGEGERRNFF